MASDQKVDIMPRDETNIRRFEDTFDKELLLTQALVLESMAEGVSVCDEHGIITLTNPAFDDMFGYQRGELRGKHVTFLNNCAPEVNARIFAEVNACLVRHGFWSGEFNNRKKDGTAMYTHARICSLAMPGKKLWVTVQEDITEQKKALAEVEQLNISLSVRASELEAANLELESFCYTISHDLRKPLTIINGYCQVMRELCSNLNKPCEEYLQEICETTLHMNGLIDTMLNFSLLTKREMHKGTTDLSGIVTELALGLKMAEPQRQVSFLIAKGVVVLGDANLLRVALENLLGNAWKYTAKNDEALIEFGVTESDGTSAYFVRDNGVGFDMANAEKLFTPFQRLPGTEKFKGFGIGLATVQRIIHRHDGKVWAEGEVGKGATFYFTLH